MNPQEPQSPRRAGRPAGADQQRPPAPAGPAQMLPAPGQAPADYGQAGGPAAPPGPPAAGGQGPPAWDPAPYGGQPAPPASHRPLILSRASARGSFKIEVQPDRALLFTDTMGGVVRVAAYPSFLELRKYRVRFEVDMARRHSEFVFDVPSRSRPASFVVTLQVSWGVTDPCEIVRIGLEDGLPILQPRLEEIVAGIGTDYPIGEFIEFQQRLNRTLAQQRPVFPEGVGVFHCSARVRQDERYRSQINDIDDERHKISVSNVREAWVDHIDSEWGLLRQHLRQNPGNIPEVLAELRQRAANGNARDDERLKLLLNSDLVTDIADLESVMPIVEKGQRYDSQDLIDRPRIRAERVPEVESAREDAEEQEEEEEDVLPGEIVEDGDDVEWVPAPWTQGGA